MKLYHVRDGVLLENDGTYRRSTDLDWNDLFVTDELSALLRDAEFTSASRPAVEELLPPVADQEVWGAGVTYDRSKTARMEESKEAGGSDFYDRVYVAERPEIFFKATPSRTVGPGDAVRIRSDSTWSVPEPEFTLAVNRHGSIFGYTIGNDVCARDIEGENPLYLPQAKVYDRSCAVGPCLLLTQDEGLSPETPIRIRVDENGTTLFEDETKLSAMKRSPEELVRYLFDCNVFPDGCLLLTGTGVVPPDTFSLEGGETVTISVPPIGDLTNPVIR